MTDDVVLVEHTDATEERDNDAVAADRSSTDIEPTTKGEGDSEPAKKKEGGGAGEKPEALQIVSIGTEEDQYAFTFHEEQLNLIISRIPPGKHKFRDSTGFFNSN